MTTQTPAMRRQLLNAIPFLVAVPIVIGAIAVALGVQLQPPGLLVGAIGWIVALALRGPVALVAMRRTGDAQRAQPAIIASSGPLEEVVRLAAVLLLGRDLDMAFSIGLGWAAIEVVYSIVNGFAVSALAGRTDPEAEQARAMLPAMMLDPSAPWWGIVERIWASLLHIGFTLIVAAQPILVVLTAIVHSATNVLLTREVRRGRSLAQIQVGGTVLALVVLAVGLLLI